jgi:hypothetical protein
MRPIAPRPRWPGSTIRSTVISSSSNPIVPKAAPGMAGPAQEWEPVLKRAGVGANPTRVAQAYLELAVLVRALQGLADMARIESVPDRSSLWAGLFDLRENLERAEADLRALAA